MKPSIFETHQNLDLAEVEIDSIPAPKKSDKLEIDWVNSLFLTLTPVAAVALSWIYFKGHGFELSQIILGIIFYFATGIAITAGYHRLLSHKAYKSGNIVKFFYLIFGAAAFQNSALKWATDHRIHHRHVDHEKDPYNINKGFFYAHMGWIFYKEQTTETAHYPKDLLNDRLVMWQHRNYMTIAVVMGFVLPTVIGYFLGSALGGLALSGFLRIVFVHHCTFFINSLCHVVGTRPYTETNTARDSYIMALFSYGEGYHNYHHYFPSDYRNGIRWYHFDPTKWLIKFLSFVGLVRDLKKVPEKLITQAKVEMRSKKFQTV
ncbi:MAG: fatty acid desaturase [Bacteriovorax sp.]|jgi:stearoyl-CoA desaturase (delta-9 desaturase)